MTDIGMSGYLNKDDLIADLRNENDNLHATNARLVTALREAWPYVPEHHLPVQHKIAEAFAAYGQSSDL